MRKICQPIPRYALLLLVLRFGTFTLTAQTRPDGSAPQFLFPVFTEGNVLMKNGTRQSSMLNYNVVSEKMVYEKDDKIYDITNAELIDTVFMQGRKFVPSGRFFYEVLVNAPVPLLVQFKGEVIPPGVPVGYGGTSQLSSATLLRSVELSSGYWNLKLPEDYLVKVDPVYWIRKDTAIYSFINERQFLKIFPESENDLKQFIRQNKIKFTRMTDIISLVREYNQMSGHRAY